MSTPVSPPKPKRRRLSQPITPDVASHTAPDMQRPSRAEFPVSSLEEFYKACPTYRLPLEVGAFSIDGAGVFRPDRSELRYYSPPGRVVNMDLRVGYSEFVPKSKENVPENGLEPVLKWISHNGDCFRPQTGPTSPEKNGEAVHDSGLLLDSPPAQNKRLITHWYRVGCS